MKSFLYKTLLGFALIAVSFVANNAEAQYVDNYYYNDQYQYGGGQYQQYGDQSSYIAQLMQIIQQLQSQLESQQYGGYNQYGYQQYQNPYNYYPVGGSGSGSNDSRPDVDTESARDIEDDSAEIRGEVDMNDFNNGIVFFVYGQDEDAIEDVEDDYDEYSDVNDDEEDDDFEVVRVDSDLDGDDDYEKNINNLEDDEEYFFIICVEYEDDDDDETLECGDVEEFDTDDNDEDEPDVDTQSATDIDDDSAELRGEVDMNDFNNGKVFFVWGENESDIEDVENEDRYSDIDEDGDDLQKTVVDTDLDGNDEYEENIYNLNDNTDIYFRICVEYEDEDDDDTLECGDVRDFETD